MAKIREMLMRGVFFLAALASILAVIPVSYTHLDVYKRQHQRLSNPNTLRFIFINGLFGCAFFRQKTLKKRDQSKSVYY